MSCVLSQLFNHKDGRSNEYQLKSYALDDKFYLHMDQYNACTGWYTSINMNFSVAEAKILKRQLAEFIAQNT